MRFVGYLLFQIKGAIAPAMVPIATENASTTPTGIWIDCKPKKDNWTGVAFCTDKIAIAPTQTAKITQINMAGIGFIIAQKVITSDRQPSFVEVTGFL